MIRSKTLPNKLDFDSIKVGDIYSFERSFRRGDGLVFARLSGDFNPLHLDREFGKKSKFKENVVAGMLVSSLFSALVGMHCPGEKSLYLGQKLRFIKPVFYGDKIRIKGLVVSKSDSIQTINLKTEAWRGNTKVVDGEALVKFLS